MTDAELIEKLGGSTKVAEILTNELSKKLSDDFTPQRVNNWRKRGIPAQIKLDYPHLFNKNNQQPTGA